MIDSEWLQILCCPETRQSVATATEENLRVINNRISQGEIKNRAGQVMHEALEAVLVRQDGQVGYPVRQGIPVMLVSEALVL